MKDRDYSKEHTNRQSKYIRKGFDIPRQQYAALTPAQQKTLSQRVRECIKEFLKGRVRE